MNRILKKLKRLRVLVLGGLLSLIFTNGAKAQPMRILYGPPQPTPKEMLSRLLPFIGGLFFAFVIAPVAGLIWYRKRGGTKRWPSTILWILVAFFVLALVALTILILMYSQF